jgi:hypothetical protein
MLKENTIERLTDMMHDLAQKAAVRDAADLLCWTPLAPLIRAARRARIQENTRDIRMRQKAAKLCAEVQRDHADLLVPAWT